MHDHTPRKGIAPAQIPTILRLNTFRRTPLIAHLNGTTHDPRALDYRLLAPRARRLKQKVIPKIDRFRRTFSSEGTVVIGSEFGYRAHAARNS